MSYVRWEDPPDTDASVSDGLVKHVYSLFKKHSNFQLKCLTFLNHTFVSVKNVTFGVVRKYC